MRHVIRHAVIAYYYAVAATLYTPQHTLRPPWPCRYYYATHVAAIMITPPPCQLPPLIRPHAIRHCYDYIDYLMMLSLAFRHYHAYSQMPPLAAAYASLRRHCFATSYAAVAIMPITFIDIRQLR